MKEIGATLIFFTVTLVLFSQLPPISRASP